MFCPKCQEENTKSTLQLSGGSMTLMCNQPFYDVNGHYHNHDPNIFTQNWSCSNGHGGDIKSSHSCYVPGCNFKGMGPIISVNPNYHEPAYIVTLSNGISNININGC